MHIRLLATTIGHTIQHDFIWLHHTNFSVRFPPREQMQVLVKFNQMSRVEYYF